MPRRPAPRHHVSGIDAAASGRGSACGWLAVALLWTAACGTPAPTLPTATNGSAGAHAAGAAADEAAPFAITVVVATYGKLLIATLPAATCRARTVLPSGGLVLGADFLVDQVADPDGQARWLYRTPVAGAGSGTGRYEVTCVTAERSVDARASFDVP